MKLLRPTYQRLKYGLEQCIKGGTSTFVRLHQIIIQCLAIPSMCATKVVCASVRVPHPENQQHEEVLSLTAKHVNIHHNTQVLTLHVARCIANHSTGHPTTTSTARLIH